MGSPPSIKQPSSPFPVPALACRLTVLGLGLLAMLTGCVTGPKVLKPEQQVTIDRAYVEYPTGFELKPYMVGLTAPNAIAWDGEGNPIIAEGGDPAADPHIFRVNPDGTTYDIYPRGPRIPFVKPGFRIYGPVGGMVAYNGQVYVSHRDANDNGMITAFGYDGSHKTIVGDLPAQGDFSVTDMVVQPGTGVLFFGVGAATNSGVVGLDNWLEGWVRKHPRFHDLPPQRIKLQGFRFDAKNPLAGLFSGGDIAVTSPYQPFGVSNATVISPPPDGKPTGAIYAVSPDGGGLEVWATGVRNPAGLAADRYRVYFTDQGMELRGTRPVADDPDEVFQLSRHAWYGFPDAARNFEPISNPRYQPPSWMVLPSGYDSVAAVIDHEASGLHVEPRTRVADLPPLSGGSKMDIVPSGPFNRYNGDLVVCLWGDRAPFATNHQPMKYPTGYKVVLVDPSAPPNSAASNFVYNVRLGPASRHGRGAEGLERPIDAKFGPDGNLYLIDYGKTVIKDGKQKVSARTGKIYRLVPVQPKPTTTTTTTQAAR